jgi:hypothetical protein
MKNIVKKWWFYVIIVIVVIGLCVLFFIKKAESDAKNKYIGEWVSEQTFHIRGYSEGDINAFHKETLKIEDTTFSLDWYDIENDVEVLYKLSGQCEYEDDTLILTVTDVQGEREEDINDFMDNVYYCEYEQDFLRIKEEGTNGKTIYAQKDSIEHNKMKCLNKTEDIVYYLESNFYYIMYIRSKEEIGEQYYIHERTKIVDNTCTVTYRWKDTEIDFVYNINTAKLDYIEFISTNKNAETTYQMHMALLEGLLYSTKESSIISVEKDILDYFTDIIAEVLAKVEYDKKINVIRTDYEVEYEITDEQSSFRIYVK